MKVLKQLCLLLAVVVSASATAAGLNRFGGFKVEREVLIDPDHTHHPLALLRAADDGYFVLEGGYGNGVVKVDRNGKTEWLYRDPDPEIYVPHHRSTVEFSTAAASSDGGVLLGGHRGKLGDHGRDRLGGVLILFDKHGREVSRIDPAGDDVDHRAELADVYAVARWGDGFAAIVATNHEQFVFRLRPDGSILWKKNLNMQKSAGSERSEARSTSSGDLVVRGLSSVVRLNDRGDKLQEVDIDASCTWIAFNAPDDRAQFLCQSNGGQAGQGLQLVEVDSAHSKAQITELPHLKEQLGSAGLTRAYSPGDGGFVLMGSTQGLIHSFVPILLEANADQAVIARKEFVGRDENMIRDGMPTGAPGEWVIIRPVLRDSACTALTFLRRY
ncbi:hypothetical protein CH75_05860 [Dyella jiangningensis]|nr:hypothetical protein CH75_05860 [Dyella jiangningensis]